MLKVQRLKLLRAVRADQVTSGDVELCRSRFMSARTVRVQLVRCRGREITSDSDRVVMT